MLWHLQNQFVGASAIAVTHRQDFEFIRLDKFHTLICHEGFHTFDLFGWHFSGVL